MTFYDENGNIITLEISDNSAMLEALELQNQNLKAIAESQAETLKTMQEQNETLLAHIEAQEAKIRACLVSSENNTNKSKREHLKRILKKSLAVFGTMKNFV